jgi:hypothetical protein
MKIPGYGGAGAGEPEWTEMWDDYGSSRLGKSGPSDG